MSKRPPASIRYNNPGAMYPGPSARKFGSIGTETIGGGHKIAVFDDPVKGAAAQFDLLLRSYAGLPFGQAIAKWSGGNSSGAYAAEVARRAGLDPNAPLSADLLKNPSTAIPVARAMAGWEAGTASPLTDDQWRQAHALATGGETPAPMPAVAPSNPTPETPMDPMMIIASLFGGGNAPVGGSGAPATPSLPFGLGGAQRKEGGQADPLASIPELDSPLANMQRKPMDLSALMQLAATKRRGGIG